MPSHHKDWSPEAICVPGARGWERTWDTVPTGTSRNLTRRCIGESCSTSHRAGLWDSGSPTWHHQGLDAAYLQAQVCLGLVWFWSRPGWVGLCERCVWVCRDLTLGLVVPAGLDAGSLWAQSQTLAGGRREPDTHNQDLTLGLAAAAELDSGSSQAPPQTLTNKHFLRHMY